MRPQIAVVLFNLGGPDSRETIRPFLMNFFMDRNIIPVPRPLRYLIAWYIAFTRSRKQAGASYARLGNKSPLLENSLAQARALESVLNTDGQADFKVHVCMRYWHPMADMVAAQVKAENPDQVILLPLYPQFSTTTTWSSLEQWQDAARGQGLDMPSALVCCYPKQSGFVGAAAALVRSYYDAARIDAESAGLPAPRVLFSAHGLPEDVIRKGDPYQWQCEESARAIAAATGIENLDWQICYQSRVGPKRWTGPSVEMALEKAAKDGVPVVIFPHAFTQEHVETLVEIEEEYRHLAGQIGIKGFTRVPTVSVHAAFIAGLADMVRSRAGTAGIAADVGGRICPSGFTRCCMGMGVRLEGAQACDVRAPQV
ncbi:MAG: ferrochelatase [Rhodospirillales bacterium]|nr:ferrochelatase [Alphaproteobacteria bacterium]MCB9986611.1 ferrochelatase [Rhodospirillales bacterium]USO06859.1 MAG: ferrochelatase [Rhodospirillales bacterium]